MLKLTNLKPSNIELLNHDTSLEISLDRADQIKGSGPLSWTGAGIGGLIGGVKGAITYPVSEGWEKLMTGKSDYTLADHGGSIVGTIASGGTIGAGVGKAIESFGDGPKF